MSDAVHRRTGTPRARILLTGDELLRGFVQDANSGFVAGELRDLGIELDEIRVVGDDFETIGRVLAEARERDGIDLVVVSGGLGPTHDDRTTEAVAASMGRELQLDAAALEVVEARVRAHGRMRTRVEAETFAPGNRKQATLPAGATWVDPLGTAPGYVVADEDDAAVVVLPGPPPELRHAWRGVRATAELAALVARVGARHERLLRVWGVPESVASAALAETGHVDSSVSRVTICARDGELEIALRGSEPDAVDGLTDALAQALAPSVFAVDDHRGVVALVAAQLQARGWRLATAESCTGGLLGGRLTAEAGASSWYLGGLVTYANSAKEQLAHVRAATLEQHGAVSEQAARELARGACRALGAQVGVGITGVAGPGGGSEDKPVGTVHVAIAAPGGEVHRQLRMPGDRATVRQRSCNVALHELRMLLESLPVGD